MIDLLKFLGSFPPGPVTDTDTLEPLLAETWDAFNGDDGGMSGYKLWDRMEKVEWHPPILSFVIERHGGTCCGSTRAELQGWELDVEQMTVITAKTVSYRQLCWTAERFDIKALAEELAGLIVKHESDEWLVWRKDGTVQVRASTIFPAKSDFIRTVESRRKRLHEAVVKALAGTGWAPQDRHVFRHSGREASKMQLQAVGEGR